MHHLAHSMTKLGQGRERDNAGWEGVPVYDSSGGESCFIVVYQAICLMSLSRDRSSWPASLS